MSKREIFSLPLIMQYFAAITLSLADFLFPLCRRLPRIRPDKVLYFAPGKNSVHFGHKKTPEKPGLQFLL